MLHEKDNLSMVLKEKNDIEKKNNEVNNIEINNLKMNLSNIIVVLKTLFKQESEIYKNRNDFFNKLNTLQNNKRINQDFGNNFEYNNNDNL